MSTPVKYNKIQVLLHWITAVLVLFMLLMGIFVLEEMPNSDPIKLVGLKGHMIIGVIVLVLTIVRIVWRYLSAQPAHVKTNNALLDKLAVFAHIALNLLTLLVVLSGIGISIQAGLPDIVFGGQGVLPESFNEFPARIAHGILVKLLTLLVIVHIIAAYYHQLVLKDNLFSRMLLKEKADD